MERAVNNVTWLKIMSWKCLFWHQTHHILDIHWMIRKHVNNVGTTKQKLFWNHSKYGIFVKKFFISKVSVCCKRKLVQWSNDMIIIKKITNSMPQNSYLDRRHITAINKKKNKALIVSMVVNKREPTETTQRLQWII